MTWCPSLGLAEDYGPLVWRSVCQFFGENDSNFCKYLNAEIIYEIIDLVTNSNSWVWRQHEDQTFTAVGTARQCDQMARLFFQYLAINKIQNKIWSHVAKIKRSDWPNTDSRDLHFNQPCIYVRHRHLMRDT